jgi:hypothetical protein
MIKFISIITFLLIASNCAPFCSVSEYLRPVKLNLNNEYKKNIIDSTQNNNVDSTTALLEKLIILIYPPIRQHSIKNVYIHVNRKPNQKFLNYYGLKPILIDSEKILTGRTNYLLFRIDFKNNKYNYNGHDYDYAVLNFKYYGSKKYQIIFEYKILFDDKLNPIYIKQISDRSHTFAI